jgi:hypothetical protein
VCRSGSSRREAADSASELDPVVVDSPARGAARAGARDPPHAEPQGLVRSEVDVGVWMEALRTTDRDADVTIRKWRSEERPMADHHSKERMRAEDAFAKMQDRSGDKVSDQPTVSAADQNTARLKAARLGRDAAKIGSKEL